MRWLVGSLFFAVFLSLLGFGWAIDYYYTITTQQYEDNDSGYRTALNLVVNHINNNNLAIDDINHYLKTVNLPIIIEPLTNYPLPRELISDRDQGNIFVLESETGISLHKRIGNRKLIASLGPILTEQDNYKTRFLLTVVFYMGIAAILLIWLLPLLKGIDQLTLAAKNIGLGKLNTRIKYPDRFYLAPLNKVFNAMAEKLQHLNDHNQILSQAVSHELRTPLSRLRFAVDLIESRKSEEQKSQDIKRMSQDLDQMESLINELLLYARLDKDPILRKDYVKFEYFIQEIIQNWINEKCQIIFQNDFSQRKVLLDSKYCSRVVNNILQNACKYGKGEVRVTCIWKKECVELNIEDNGEGIPEDQWHNIFKPFTRIDNISASLKPGFGLGLAICKSIMKWHGGDINVTQSNTLGGAQFKIIFPFS